MKRFLAWLCVTLAWPAWSAEPAAAEVRAAEFDSVTIESRILDADRRLHVSLPDGYETGERGYPLLFLTDADWNFDLVRAYLEFTGDRYPDMIIAGIINTDRNRDYVPAVDPNFPGTGGADTFLRALSEEILPALDRRYRTSGRRIYFGHSFGGTFGLHAMLRAPELGLEQAGARLVAGPLRQVVVHVHHPHAVEDVTGRTERVRNPPGPAEVEQLWEREPHPPAFVGDRGATAAAGELAGQDALRPSRGARIEAQAIDAGRDAHVPLVEYRRPLHGCAVQHLAVPAVAELGIHGVGSHLVAHGAAVATGRVLRRETGVAD